MPAEGRNTCACDQPGRHGGPARRLRPRELPPSQVNGYLPHGPRPLFVQRRARQGAFFNFPCTVIAQKL